MKTSRLRLRNRIFRQIKIISLFSYVYLLVLVPIFAAKDSAFAKFHANQGLIIFIANVVLQIVRIIISTILGLSIFHKVFIISLLFSGVSIIISIALWAVGVVLFALQVYGVICACQGKAVKFPFVSDYTILK